MARKPQIRCAVYTRKSSEEGLEQEFNSLHAQREACAAYIASQKHEGWTLLPDLYDDGGISGGTLERPALHQLMQDIDDGKVDQIVVYKIDRLTRSLADFAKLVDRLDAVGASFVSVTQSFNTATSMGRLTLNVLLSFAQFEREVTAERIRDKIAASKKKGMWMGGAIPLGYEPHGRTLKIREDEAKTVRALYDVYLKLGNIKKTTAEMNAQGYRTAIRPRKDGSHNGGIPFGVGTVRNILSNPVYKGAVSHKGKIYQGQHEAIIDPGEWQKVQDRLFSNAQNYRKGILEQAPLTGKLFDELGKKLTPSSSNKHGVQHRYYMSMILTKTPVKDTAGTWRLPAKPLELSIRKAIQHHLFSSPYIQQIIDQQSISIGQQSLKGWISKLHEESPDREWVELIERVEISQGNLHIALQSHELAKHLPSTSKEVPPQVLTFNAPFQLRRRHVEQKVILESHGEETAKDETLIKNVAKAHMWYEAIKTGTSIPEIATNEGVTTSRIRRLIKLAFLAPDIIESILEGKQPPGLTTEWLIRNKFPSDWQEQRKLFQTL